MAFVSNSAGMSVWFEQFFRGSWQGDYNSSQLAVFGDQMTQKKNCSKLRVSFWQPETMRIFTDSLFALMWTKSCVLCRKLLAYKTILLLPDVGSLPAFT